MSRITTILLVMVFLSLSILINNNSYIIPVSGDSSTQTLDMQDSTSNTLQLPNGKQFLVAGQPGNNIGYVSNMPDVVTKFQQAEKLGSFGLIAHNYLSGEEFFNLEIGDEIAISNEDGIDSDTFRVVEIKQYQALQPTSIHSQFRSLENDEIISAHELSQAIYGQNGYMILQTCIENDGNFEWGRLFVIAEPVNA